MPICATRYFCVFRNAYLLALVPNVFVCAWASQAVVKNTAVQGQPARRGSSDASISAVSATAQAHTQTAAAAKRQDSGQSPPPPPKSKAVKSGQDKVSAEDSRGTNTPKITTKAVATPAKAHAQKGAQSKQETVARGQQAVVAPSRRNSTTQVTLGDVEVRAVDATGLGHAANRLIEEHFAKHKNLDVDLVALAKLMVDDQGQTSPKALEVCQRAGRCLCGEVTWLGGHRKPARQGGQAQWQAQPSRQRCRRVGLCRGYWESGAQGHEPGEAAVPRPALPAIIRPVRWPSLILHPRSNPLPLPLSHEGLVVQRSCT